MGITSALVCLSIFAAAAAVCGCISGLLLALSAAAVALVVNSSVLTRAPRVLLRGRAVLITGCDSGFGFELARRLDGMGVRVLAGCLQPDGEGARELASKSSDRLRVLPFDVTSDEQVQEARAAVTRMGRQADLWAVVNNAGITHLGEVEMCNMNSYQRAANVNLWGTIRTTMAFLPLVKASKGRIVNMSSISAHLHTPFNSAYCVSKSGVDAFSNCLRVEMKKWDVKVVLIEPGTFISHTNIMQNQDTKSIYRSLTESQKTQFTMEYIDTYMKASQSFRKIECKNPGLVIDAIVEALTAGEPDTCYMVCSFIEKAIVFLLMNLPTAWTDIIFTSTLNESKRRSILARNSMLKSEGKGKRHRKHQVI
ncbi:D-beta-hydroxybutyrate dehydrogenase, mitochondrial-like [Petromyzon marinus]|uniref:D-beta-hydroxybutyrate dehydrogenase, mitochondrial-like n=1 Tax=Petromyzon marinus TaxID=7757 RepID=UPI003F700231